jgi:hypothetical protein
LVLVLLGLRSLHYTVLAVFFLSFKLYDVDACGVWSTSSFSGGAQAIVESTATSGFEGENVQQITLWAQSEATGYRYADTTNAFTYQTLPSTYPPLTYIRSTNVIDLGWNNGGQTYSSGTQLWSQTESAGLEQYPGDCS